MLAGAIISYSSRREWAAEKAGLLAKGEKLSFAELVPEAHLDERNFFFDPMWMELIDTKPAPSNSQMEVAEPKVPKGRRQLDSINKPVSGELRERALRLLPELKKSNSSVNPDTICHAAYAEIMVSESKEKWGELSRLIFDAVNDLQPLLKRLDVLSRRPEAVYPYNPAFGWGNSKAHWDYLYRLPLIDNAIAWAYFAEGDYRSAANTLENLFLVSRALREDPFYWAVVARHTHYMCAFQVIRRGIAEHIWNAEELEKFEEYLKDANFPRETAAAFRAERGGANQLIEAMMKDGRGRDIWKGGEGFQDLSFLERQIAAWSFPFCIATDQVRLNRLHQLIIEYCENPNGKVSDHLGKLGEVSFPWRGLHVPSISQQSLWPGNIEFMMRNQDEITRTRIACALERYRLAKGEYPSDLGALVPEFLPQLPRCVIPQRSFEWTDEKDVYHLKLTDGVPDDLLFPEKLNSLN